MSDLATISHAEALSHAQIRDEESFRQLVIRFKKPVYLLALRWTGSAEDAEDIAQETFLRAYAHQGELDPERDAKCWLLKVAANLCRNHRRARWRRWQSLLNFFEHMGRNEAKRDYLLQDQLQRALGDLTPDLRAAVILVWIQGLTHREAGEVLGISEGTVSWRLFKARQKMRKWLDVEQAATANPGRGGRKL